MDATKEIEKWLTGPFDKETKSEILKLQKEDPQELEKAFGSNLSFGTGGMREIMGVGTARMNRYTIQMATQGLCNALKNAFPNEKLRAFVGYDSRHHSKEFAEETAKVFAGNGIDVFLPDSLCSTPFTSFACRELKCHTAVMITASHNPPEYNGYKVYWQDGAQVVAPHDEAIVKAVSEISDISQISHDRKGVINSLPENIYDNYYAAIKSLALLPEENQAHGKELNILYTSLHGSGITLTPQALESWGFTNFKLVSEQCVPDGDFPTAHSPNPESAEGLSLGIKELKKENCDLLIANDPDADRIGIAIFHEGKARRMSGNEMAAICLHHILEHHKKVANPAVVTTIVTTELFSAIAKAFDVTCFEVLTGFKYIGEKIREWEDGSHTFLFGAEESMGYLLGTHCRDKDGTVLACLICEIALKQKQSGKTLYDLLLDLYKKYGTYREKVLSIPLAKEAIVERMKQMREAHPKEFFGRAVVEKTDYMEETLLPKSNVLLFRLDDGSKVIFRPSGTEPKMKVYLSIKGDNIEKLDQELERRGKKLALN